MASASGKVSAQKVTHPKLGEILLISRVEGEWQRIAEQTALSGKGFLS